MRRQLVTAAALLTFTLPFVQPLLAQDPPPPPPPARGGMNASPEQIVDRMAKSLSLTDDQKTKLTPIIADRQAKLKALREDTSTSRQDKFAKMKEINDAADTQINAVLTPDQQKQYKDMQEKMRERMRDRRDGGPAPAPTNN